MNNLISENKLKSDVDFAYKKLQQLHPNLYWYISKKDLDYKFDSLKTTLTKPISSFEFFTKISPVIASIREGHLTVSPSLNKRTKKESIALLKKGTGPFSQFEFELFNDKLYVTKNKSSEKSIALGSEVVAVNGKNTIDLLKEYNKWFASDGYNLTYKKKVAGLKLASYYSAEHGIQDSILYTFKFKDSIKKFTIKRTAEDKPNTQDKTKKKPNRKDRSIYGYDEITKVNNRSLKFFETDSSVALMKIRSFSNGKSHAFYKKSFKKIETYKSKTLIIDLRDNYGGRLDEINDLYSFLTDSTFVFLKKSEVASKTSLFSAIKNSSLLVKILAAPFYPFVYFKVHQEKNGKFYYPTYSKPQKIKSTSFKGKIYVIIDGGSFSASSIISSNLKGSKRAFFVGEETGGGYNGTVAGRMPMIQLPNSKIKINLGLLFIAPYHQTTIEGHGIFPDKEIIPTLEDRINENDPELNWVLENIKTNHTGN